MKKFISSEAAKLFLATLILFGLARFTEAAGSQDAKVTEVIHDVRVLAGNEAGHAATVNEPVRAGQAVRTGGESRAELTFTDQTITRLGSNTVFSYGQNGKEFELSNGAALMVVPKEAGSVRVNTAAATAAVTGFTMLVESHPKGVNKFMVLEGEACVKNRVGGVPTGACTTIHAGEMLILQPSLRGSVHTFDIRKTTQTAKLITGFKGLPKWAKEAINTAIEHQGSNKDTSGGPKDATDNSARDQRAAAQPTPASNTLGPPPGTPPGRNQPNHP